MEPKQFRAGKPFCSPGQFISLTNQLKKQLPLYEKMAKTNRQLLAQESRLAEVGAKQTTDTTRRNYFAQLDEELKALNKGSEPKIDISLNSKADSASSLELSTGSLASKRVKGTYVKREGDYIHVRTSPGGKIEKIHMDQIDNVRVQPKSKGEYINTSFSDETGQLGKNFLKSKNALDASTDKSIGILRKKFHKLSYRERTHILAGLEKKLKSGKPLSFREFAIASDAKAKTAALRKIFDEVNKNSRILTSKSRPFNTTNSLEKDAMVDSILEKNKNHLNKAHGPRLKMLLTQHARNAVVRNRIVGGATAVTTMIALPFAIKDKISKWFYSSTKESMAQKPAQLPTVKNTFNEKDNSCVFTITGKDLEFGLKNGVSNFVAHPKDKNKDKFECHDFFPEEEGEEESIEVTCTPKNGVTLNNPTILHLDIKRDGDVFQTQNPAQCSFAPRKKQTKTPLATKPAPPKPQLSKFTFDKRYRSCVALFTLETEENKKFEVNVLKMTPKSSLFANKFKCSTKAKSCNGPAKEVLTADAKNHSVDIKVHFEVDGKKYEDTKTCSWKNAWEESKPIQELKGVPPEKKGKSKKTSSKKKENKKQKSYCPYKLEAPSIMAKGKSTKLKFRIKLTKKGKEGKKKVKLSNASVKVSCLADGSEIEAMVKYCNGQEKNLEGSKTGRVSYELKNSSRIGLPFSAKIDHDGCKAQNFRVPKRNCNNAANLLLCLEDEDIDIGSDKFYKYRPQPMPNLPSSIPGPSTILLRGF